MTLRRRSTRAPGRLALLLALTTGSLLGCSESESPTPDGGADSPSFSPAHCSYEEPPAAGPRGPSAAAALRAGAAEVALNLPVGTPLGGYTARVKLLGGSGPDARRAPWARTFAPSGGVQTQPQGRALYLQAGDESFVLIKVDLCVSTDRLVYDLEKALAADGALRGRVIVSASHSHSSFGTFQPAFHLALGFDLFQEAQYQRLLASLVQAGKAAIASARPAKLGVGVWEGWDPRDEIFSDRRGDDNKLPGADGKPRGATKDGRLTVLRVDDENDQPLAALVHFPMHGTIAGEDNPLVSVDSTGHVELALEEYFDNQVLVMHLQSSAGDVSPRGAGGMAPGCDEKKRACADFARMESLGELAAPRIYSLWQSVKTAPQLELEMQTRAVADGRDISVRGGALRYAPYVEDAVVDGTAAAIYDEAGQVRAPITQFNVPYGAGLCGGKGRQIPAEGINGPVDPPYASCVEIGSASKFIATAAKLPEPMVPDCVTTRTTLSALRMAGVPVVRRQRSANPNDPPVYASATEDLLFATLPGEAVTSLADKLRAGSPFGPDRTFVLGYAQGHVGYILDVENWLVGGYEPSINIYGPLEGEWLMERSLDLLKLAATKEREDGGGAAGPGLRSRLKFAAGKIEKPSFLFGTAAVVAAPPASLFTRTREPLASGQPAARVTRVGGRALFVWTGGSPEEDSPVAVLERMGANGYEPVLKRSGRRLDSRGKELILTYTPQPVDAEPDQVTSHLWAVEWQAVGWERDDRRLGLAAATGTPTISYRITVSGKIRDRAYTLSSSPFTVVKEGAVKATLTRQGAALSGKAVYPVGAGYRLLRLSGPSDGDVPVGGALTLTVRGKADGRQVTLSAPAMADGSFTAMVPAQGVDVSKGVDVTVADADGNSGQVSVN